MRTLSRLEAVYQTRLTMTHQQTKKDGFEDPYLLSAGTNLGNTYRRKRALIRMESIDMENQATIRALKLENEKLKSKLKRLREEAEKTGRIEDRFEQLSSIIMDSQFMDNSVQSNDNISDDEFE